MLGGNVGTRIRFSHEDGWETELVVHHELMWFEVMEAMRGIQVIVLSGHIDFIREAIEEHALHAIPR